MNERILIIDDEPLVLATLERALKKVDYLVCAVSCKEDFGSALLEGVFDMAILDLHLPGAITEELAMMAMEKNPEIKFLYVSGSTTPPGEKNFLQKPFRIEDLREMVRAILDA